MHAAASSIGQAAIQLAVSHGIKVIATARSQDKVDLCTSLGAAAGVVVGSDSKFSDAVKAANDGKPVDVILDPVGASYLNENVDVIDYDGRLVMYGLLSGPKVEDPQFLKKLLFKRANLLPSTLRARDVTYKAELIQNLQQDENALPAVARGDIKVDISAVFPLERVRDAHAMMARNENAGKIVLKIHSGDDKDEL
jgi:NADPH:quinone reductase-like Zn-dependent oxidoreductase